MLLELDQTFWKIVMVVTRHLNKGDMTHLHKWTLPHLLHLPWPFKGKENYKSNRQDCPTMLYFKPLKTQCSRIFKHLETL